MKRLCLILAYLFLFTQTAFAMPLLIGQKVVYRGTVTGLRISAVDGTAFIDNLPYTYSSDFSAGVDGWTGSRGTVAGDIDSIGGEDNWLRLTIDTQNDVHYAIRTSLFTIGKQYTVSFRYYIPSGQTVLAGVQATGATYKSTLDAATTVTYTWTATTTNLRFYATSSAGSTVIQDAGGDDVFYIKDITISEIQPYMDGNHQIEIYDASNRMLRGVLKAAGASETLGADLLSGFDFTSGWGVAGTGSIIDSNSFSSTGSGGVNKSVLSSLRLYKRAYEKSTTAASSMFRISNTMGYISPDDTDLATGSKYSTAIPNYLFCYARNSTAGTTDVTTFTVQQVLTPSSSGATITTLKNGDVYNWSYKNSSFTYNAASYYVIIRAIR